MGAVGRVSRRRAKPSARGLRPTAALICALILVRALSQGGTLQDVMRAVQSWHPGESFSLLMLRGAGLPGAAALSFHPADMLAAQNSALLALRLDLPPAPAADTFSGAPHGAPEGIADPKRSVVPSLSSPVPYGYPWSIPGLPDGSNAPVGDAASGVLEAPLDDRVLPVPDASDPDARQVQEVTLLAPKESTAAVFVINDTSYALDIPKLLKAAPKLKAAKAGQPQILILHTHGSESFLPDERDWYVPTDIERTEDTRYNVVRLGDEMADRLGALGLTVLHDRTIYDYPTYRTSYSRALSAIQEHVKKNPSLQMVIDIHRDSIQGQNGAAYKTVSVTDEGKAAQMMFVIGSNASGLVHDHWRDNLSLAAQLEKQIADTYPTLMRPIHLRKERFNQHATCGSMILEVGTAANSLTEALLSVDLFCRTAGPKLAELFGVT